MRSIVTLVLLTALLSPSGFASPGAAPAKSQKNLWDHWYTVAIGPEGSASPYAYYNERVELRESKIFFQHSMWKLEEGFINEEQLGAVASGAPDFAPLFFNFRSAYRGNESIIDGSVDSSSRVLSVKVRQTGQEKPAIKKTLPKGVIFSQFFPVWLGNRIKELKPGKPVSFSAILEDAIDVGYSPVSGKVTLEAPDAFAKKSSTMKLKVLFRNDTNYWYVDAQGAAERIEMPKQRATIVRTSKESAQKFLSAPAKSGSGEGAADAESPSDSQ
jgi:hypothetical protein